MKLAKDNILIASCFISFLLSVSQEDNFAQTPSLQFLTTLKVLHSSHLLRDGEQGKWRNHKMLSVSSPRMVVVGVGALEQALAGRFGAPQVFGQLDHWCRVPTSGPCPGSDCLLGLCDCQKHLKRSCDRQILAKFSRKKLYSSQSW